MLLRKIVLFPFSLLFYLITKTRNFLYDNDIIRSTGFPFPIICVGNLKVGGTGKTPHVEYLSKFLSEHYKIGILSRGYGRKTKGFIKAGPESTPEQIGDESVQYFKRFGNNVNVYVGENRVLAVQKILSDFKRIGVLVLDDAFQHRRLKAGLNILLTEYSSPFYSDFLLPGGNLREPIEGSKRADVIIVTKCPEHLNEREKVKISDKIRKIAGNKEVFFTSYTYAEPVNLGISEILPTHGSVIAFAGIANPEGFFKHLSTRFKIYKTYRFKDHKNYSTSNIQKLISEFNGSQNVVQALVTTQKDGVKLAQFSELKKIPLFYIPIKVRFLEREDEFLQIIQRFIKNNSL